MALWVKAGFLKSRLRARLNRHRRTGPNPLIPRKGVAWAVSQTALVIAGYPMHIFPHVIIKGRKLWFRPCYPSDWFMELGLWEPYVVSAMRLSRGDVFVDVGAHIGYHALIASNRVGSEGLV